MTKCLSGLAVMAVLGVVVGSWSSFGEARAQSSARNGETGAVDALVVEVRALRAELAAATQRSLRSQMLLGRLQMQEQRIAHLDRQRADASAKALDAAQASSQMLIPSGSDTCSAVSADARRDCEFSVKEMSRQAGILRSREEQLKAQETELAAAVQAEQARWADVNARLDDLERSLR